MIEFKSKGNYNALTQYFVHMKQNANKNILSKYAQRGVEALRNATPVDTGKTAASWYYKITDKKGVASIEFHNSNIQNGVPIAIILQYGHATKNGGFIQGRDYINPAIQSVFDEMVDEVWKEVTHT